MTLLVMTTEPVNTDIAVSMERYVHRILALGLRFDVKAVRPPQVVVRLFEGTIGESRIRTIP